MASPKLPAPEVDGADMARICGVTPQTIRCWMDKGMPGCSKPTRNSLYIDLAQAIPWLRDNVWQRQDLRQAKLQAEVNILSMQEQSMAGTLIAVADIADQWARECSTMRSRLLALPTTLAVRIAGSILSQDKIADLILAHINEALNCLSGDPLSAEEELPLKPDLPKIRMPRNKRKRA